MLMQQSIVNLRHYHQHSIMWNNFTIREWEIDALATVLDQKGKSGWKSRVRTGLYEALIKIYPNIIAKIALPLSWYVNLLD